MIDQYHPCLPCILKEIYSQRFHVAMRLKPLGVAPPTRVWSVEFTNTFLDKCPAVNLTHLTRKMSDANLSCESRSGCTISTRQNFIKCFHFRLCKHSYWTPVEFRGWMQSWFLYVRWTDGWSLFSVDLCLMKVTLNRAEQIWPLAQQEPVITISCFPFSCCSLLNK